MPPKFKAALLIITACVLVAGLSWPFYTNLKVQGERAEAKIMLGYIVTLELAHLADTGEFVYFEEFYGAPMGGKEQCARPPGAVELGLNLRGCSRAPEDGGLRFAYHVLHPSDDFGAEDEEFIAEAVSGSDLDGESFVCRSQERDEWQMRSDRVVLHTQFCTGVTQQP